MFLWKESREDGELIRCGLCSVYIPMDDTYWVSEWSMRYRERDRFSYCNACHILISLSGGRFNPYTVRSLRLQEIWTSPEYLAALRAYLDRVTS